MSSFALPISPLHPTEAIDQGVISDISQRNTRYASFCHVYQLVSKYDLWATVHVLRRFTS